MTLRALLQATLEHNAARPALLVEGRSWTYGEFWQGVLRRVSQLRGHGLSKGDRVAAYLPNSPEFLELYWACAVDGLVLVPLNLRLQAKELQQILLDAEPRLVVCERAQCGELEQASAQLPLALCFVGSDDPCPAPAIEEQALAQLSGSDPAQIYYTSGTTGRPKGVLLSHANVSAHARAACAEFELGPEDVWGHFAPMFHLADAWACFAITAAGAAHCFLPRFDAARCFVLLQRHGVTITNLVPTMLQRMVGGAPAGAREDNRLRLLLSGGAPIAPELVRRVQQIFGCEYVQTYGLTETCPFLTVSLLNEEIRSLDEEQQFQYRSSTGRPFQGVDLQLIGEDGRQVPADASTVGEIRARGDSVFAGYWQQPAATAAAFVDGWFLTGDLATLEPRGFLNIVDRKKDIILTGGETVYSTEVENALYTHQLVQSVAVFPVLDPEWGEVVAAAVVRKQGQRELRVKELVGHCRLFLAPFKLPRVLYFLDELPMTGSGKIQKRLLRERCQDMEGVRVNP